MGGFKKLLYVQQVKKQTKKTKTKQTTTKKKTETPLFISIKISYRNETGTNHHGLLSTSV